MAETEPGRGPVPGPSTSWLGGRATGVGSLPGTDVREAVRMVLGELPDLPHLPELPARGPGADMVGRAASLLVDVHVDRQPSGWRLVARPGLDERRAADFLRRDLDALGEVAGGYRGPLKVQLCGPWTLAAAVELPRGGKALADAGAVRDLVGSLSEAAAAHVAEVARRVPGADVVLQLDEPALAAVRSGQVVTASGLGRVPAVEEQAAADALRAVGQASGVPVAVHCCAANPPLWVLRRAGVAAWSLDATRLDLTRPGRYDDALGDAVEAGIALWLGLVPAVDGAELSEPAVTVSPVRALWHRLGMDPSRLPTTVAVTPACGLAGASPAHARAAMASARAAARTLVDDPEV